MTVQLHSFLRLSTLLCAVAGGAGHASASQVYTVVGMPPSLDRWMYPYGDFSGTRSSAPTYTTLYSGYTTFDDRDAEFLIGFNTAAQVPAGFAPFQYRVSTAAVSTTMVVADATASFVYDPTPDPVSSYFDAGDAGATPPRAADPERTDDPDAGRSVDLFAVAYRGGFSAATWAENSPFGPPAPAPRTRNAYPIDFGGAGGAARDVSNNVTDRFQPEPLATAAAFAAGGAAMSAGETVVDGATMRFGMNAAAPGTRGYLQGALSGGKLNLIASGLQSATAFGAGPVSYPIFRTRESLLGPSSALSLTVSICLADIGSTGGVFASDGAFDNNDFIVFIDRFFAGDMGVADIGATGGVYGRDGALNNNDFIVFIDAFFAGCSNG
ncbi:MAG: GC-type dockerin domain-anchored protein [Phycisphaerales bacterium]|nr:GC-type dockerin domain-anchored protein [Phycisphaerales bacterium]